MNQPNIKASSFSLKLASYFESNWTRSFFLILVGGCVHLPSLNGALLWDDIPLIRDNPFVRSPLLILEAFRHYLFPEVLEGHYRPIQTISYIFDYFWWDKEAFGYHLTNDLLHLTSGVLLYHLLRQIFADLEERWPEKTFWQKRINSSTWAFLLALIWIVHPVHSAAVDYISGRADSLAFVFAAAGWLLYRKAQASPVSWIRRGLCLLAALAALSSCCSRESGLLWLTLFLLYLFAFDRKLRWRPKFEALFVCILLVVAYVVLRQLPQHQSTHNISPQWTMTMREMLMLRSLGDYGQLLLFPTHLHVERSVFSPALESSQSWRDALTIDYLTIGGILVLVILFCGMVRKGPGQPARLLGGAWFIVSYLPISNLIALNATVAEHWLYLPSVGVAIFLGGFFFELSKRLQQIVVACACAVVIALGGRSAVRSSDWVDPETFFRRAFAAGGSSSRIGVNLGVVYAERGEHAKAEAILRRVLEVSPDYQLARNNLAIALSNQGKVAEAQEMFVTASNSSIPPKQAYPPTCDAARNLALLRHREKDDVEALSILDRAQRDYPENWELVSLKAQIIRERDGIAKAVPVIESFVRDHWWHARGSITLGTFLMEMGAWSEAEKAFRNASRLDVHDVKALNLITLLNVRQNNFERACETQRQAIARQPDEPRQYLILAEILNKMGQINEERKMVAYAAQLESAARTQVTGN